VSARLVGHLLRVLVAAGLTAYVLLRSHPAEVFATAANASAWYILLAVLLVLVDRVLMAFRWIALLCIVDSASRPSQRRLVHIFLTSTFVGTFLPASVGGDAVRAFSVSRERVSAADAVASVFMDRMLGVASLFVLAVPGIFLARDLAADAAVLAALAMTAAACLATMLMIFDSRVAGWYARVAAAVPVESVHRAGQALIASVQRYARFRSRLLAVLAASVGVQLLRVAQAYYLGRAVGIETGPGVFLAFIPLILLIMLLPITINALGTSQAAFVWFFARAGVPNAPAFALSVLFVGLGVIGNLPGALLYASSGLPSSARRETERLQR